MRPRKLIASAIVLGVGIAGGSATLAASQGPGQTKIIAKQKLEVKVNRFIRDALRWDKDQYTVARGGTLRIINNAPMDGPHTFTVVARSDLPKTVKQLLTCKICEQLGQAHGADPESSAPPKFLYLENGTGSTTSPNVDAPGDSGITGEKKGNRIDLKVTAASGTKLSFMCLIHPWMQAEVVVR